MLVGEVGGEPAFPPRGGAVSWPFRRHGPGAAVLLVLGSTLIAPIAAGAAGADGTMPVTPESPGIADGRLRLEQDAYGSRLGSQAAEEARVLREQYRQEWLRGHPPRSSQWLGPPAAPAPAPGGGAALSGQFAREARDLHQLQQRQAAEAAILSQRARTLGLPPGAAQRQRQQFAAEGAQQQLQFEMLRPSPYPAPSYLYPPPGGTLTPGAGFPWVGGR